MIDNREDISEDIALSVIKYADMIPNRETDYNFDIEKFCDLEGKTGPYILYSTIRMKSLLNKALENGLKYNKLHLIANNFDREILLILNNFDIILEKAFDSQSLNDITEYLYRLNNSYNRFYNENHILTESDELKKESWLYLTSIVYKINNILLDILAIKIPEKM